MIFCPKCGSQNPDGATFCGGCGNAINAPAPAAAPAPEATAEAAPAQAAPEQAAPAQAAPTQTMPMAAQPAPAGAGAPMQAKKQNSMPLIIGAIVVILAAILLIVLLVIPKCSGGGGVAGGADIKTLVTGKTADAQNVLKKMTPVELDAGATELKIYASNDKMKAYAEDLFNDAKKGNVKGWDDVMNAEKAKELSGQWLLVSTADESIEEMIENVNYQLADYDLGHAVMLVTVVADDDLTNEETAKLVEGLGVTSEHCTVGDWSIKDLTTFIEKYASYAAMANSYSAYTVESAASQLEDAADELGLQRVGDGVYMSKDLLAMSVTAQFKGYAIVGVVAINPADYGMDSLIGEDYLKRLYVK